MNVAAQTRDIGVSLSGHVAIVEIRRPPHNYFDNALIRAIAEAFDALDTDPQCRAIVLAAEGKSLCAGAQELAVEIAQSGPLAVMSTRETLRRGLAEAVEAATERELVEQEWQRRTADFKEGVKAMAERRLPNFVGR